MTPQACPVCSTEPATCKADGSFYLMCEGDRCMMAGPMRDSLPEAINAWNRISYSGWGHIEEQPL